MDKVTFIEKIKAIGSCEDDAQRRELLVQLQEDGEADYDELASIKESNERLTKDNESLRSANMQLFLRVGEQRSGDDSKPNDDEKPKREFKDLFNEKGGIK